MTQAHEKDAEETTRVQAGQSFLGVRQCVDLFSI